MRTPACTARSGPFVTSPPDVAAARSLAHPATPRHKGGRFHRRRGIAVAVLLLLMSALSSLAADDDVLTPPPATLAPSGSTFPLLPGPTMLAAGTYHSCAIVGGGALRCWGDNREHQLGDGSDQERWPYAVAVIGMHEGVQSVDGGENHTCAVIHGAVRCWGINTTGQLGDGTTDDRALPNPVPELDQGVVSVVAGRRHSCALTDSGSVKCWGANNQGQIGDGTETNRLSPVDVSGLASGIQQITAGFSHVCALTDAGGVKCWGYNQFGQLGDNSTTSRSTPVAVSGLDSGVQSVHAGFDHTCALMISGGLKCWGKNGSGRLGDGTTEQRLVPVDVTGLPGGVLAVAPGNLHTCAIIKGGSVWCWGHGGTGQLGTEALKMSPVPVQNQFLTGGVVHIVSGSHHICIILGNGGSRCWGHNGSGQCGNTGLNNSFSPGVVLQSSWIFFDDFE